MHYICILKSSFADFLHFPTDLHHVSRLHLTDLPSGSPRPNLLDETLSSSSTSAALSPAASASCHQLPSRKLRPRNRFELFTLHESRCVGRKHVEKMYMSNSKSCWQKSHKRAQTNYNMFFVFGALALKSTYGRPRLQVEVKMNHGSEPAMVVHHFWVLLINFVVSTSCVLMSFFFTLFHRWNRSTSAWGWSWQPWQPWQLWQ